MTVWSKAEMSRAFVGLCVCLIVASISSFGGISSAFADDRDEWREGAAIEACEDVAESERVRCERKAKAAEDKNDRAQARMRKAHIEYLRQLADALVQDGAPRDVALAVLLRATSQLHPKEGFRKDDVLIAAWRAQALARGGDDPLVYALLMMAPDGDAAPEREVSESASIGQKWRTDVARRWRVSDPDNLASIWASHLRNTTTVEGDRAADAPRPAMTIDPTFFADARRATKYDTAYDDIARLMIAAMRRHPPSEAMWKNMRGEQSVSHDAYAANLGLNMWVSNMPAFQHMVMSCKGESLAFQQRREDCRHIAELMATHSDTLIARLIGIAIGRYSARDAADKQAFAAQRRTIDWQMAQWRLANEADTANEGERFAALISTHADISESEIMRRTIEMAGLPLEPPQDWESGYEFPDERNADAASKATP